MKEVDVHTLYESVHATMYSLKLNNLTVCMYVIIHAYVYVCVYKFICRREKFVFTLYLLLEDQMAFS